MFSLQLSCLKNTNNMEFSFKRFLQKFFAIIKNCVLFVYRRFFHTLSSYGVCGKIFWIVISCIICWNMVSIFLLTFIRFRTESIGIDVRTDYAKWKNLFPSISICLSANRGGDISQFLDANNISRSYTKNIREILFISYKNSRNINCNNANSTCNIDFNEARKQILPNSCHDIMTVVFFLNRRYEDCEDLFKFHETSIGYCFIANNIMDYSTKALLPLQYNITNTVRSLRIALQPNILWKYELYVDSPEEMPSLETVYSKFLSYDTMLRFKVWEIENTHDILHENIAQRKCRFPNEYLIESIYHYSYSSCKTDFIMHLQLKKCGCTVHTSPAACSYHNFLLTIQNSTDIFFNKFTDRDYYCDLKGLACIENNGIVEKPEDFGAECLPSCLEQQISLVGEENYRQQKIDDHLNLEINIANFPIIRFTRNRRETYLDLVVSAGGIIGLFIGASLLNIVEIIFNIFN